MPWHPPIVPGRGVIEFHRTQSIIHCIPPGDVEIVRKPTEGGAGMAQYGEKDENYTKRPVI